MAARNSLGGKRQVRSSRLRWYSASERYFWSSTRTFWPTWRATMANPSECTVRASTLLGRRRWSSLAVWVLNARKQARVPLGSR